MAISWTTSQQHAMNVRGKTVLVSAAAGSGKTATLTERIIRRLTDSNDPADISNMLIVTFTRAAAAELRAKIFTALSDALASQPSSKHLTSQLLKLGGAKICTIDSFYFDILQSNITSLDMKSSIRIADDAEYTLLAQSVMNDTIEDFYKTEPNFSDLIEALVTARGSGAIADIFLDIYGKLETIPEGIDFIRQQAKSAVDTAHLDFFETSYGKILQQYCINTFEHYILVYTKMLDPCTADEVVQAKYFDAIADDLDFCENLLRTAKKSDCGYCELQDLLFCHTFEKLGKIDKKSVTSQSLQYKALRNEFKKIIDKLKKKQFSKSSEFIKRAMLDTSKYISILYDLLHNFEVRITEEKERVGILTFSDIRRKTLALLVDENNMPTDIAKSYAEQFSDIYIDEYQDVDGVQDLIFTSISKPDNRFMVGDIKQSIYGFRGAEPKLFSSYLTAFPKYPSAEADSSDCCSIFMSDNFRCDKNIIDFTNLVCSRIFSVNAESIHYTEDDDLKFSKRCNDGYVSPKVKIAIIEPNEITEESNDDLALDLPDSLENDEPDKHELEADYIANEISSLLSYGTKADGSKLLPKDIAVLFRSKKIGYVIADALKKRGIRSSNSDAERYFENPDVLNVLCLLNAIDNPERDIHLAGTLCSPIFGFSIDELVRIRISADTSYSLYEAVSQYSINHSDALSIKCAAFVSRLERWQSEAAALPIDEFLQSLFFSEEFVASGLLSQSDESGENENLILLYEYARGFESNNFKGLYQFIEYINSLIEEGEKLSANEGTPSDDCVRLMTIHKSKGLEFPVCFVCNATKSIRSRDVKDSMVFKYPYGIATKISLENGIARINTPMRDAILSKISLADAEEEMRLLYVALTRARERLYVTAAPRFSSDKLFDNAAKRNNYFDKYTVLDQCSSYLDWIMLSCPHVDNSVYEYDIILDTDYCENVSQDIPILISEDSKLTERLKNSFAFKYEYASLRTVPSKLSVSSLYPDILDENDTSLSLFSEDKKTTIPDVFLDTKKAYQSSAERGTATHLFLQFCDFSNAKENGVYEELSRLEKKKFLPPNAASLLYINELERFFESELCDKILTAERIVREQRFNIELAPNDFTKNQELIQKMQGEKLAIQGVIDLILINKNGEITLVDYKTDRLSYSELSNDELASEKLNSSHATQLSYYAKAVELLFGKKCERIAIYSTHSAKLYDVDINSCSEQNLF